MNAAQKVKDPFSSEFTTDVGIIKADNDISLDAQDPGL